MQFDKQTILGVIREAAENGIEPVLKNAPDAVLVDETSTLPLHRARNQRDSEFPGVMPGAAACQAAGGRPGRDRADWTTGPGCDGA